MSGTSDQIAYAAEKAQWGKKFFVSAPFPDFKTWKARRLPKFDPNDTNTWVQDRDYFGSW